MKIDRNTQIGGQPAKLVRDLLSDATNSDGFHADLVDEHLFRAWWRATIDALIETGKLDRSNRGHALRLWTNARERDKIFGLRLPKVPDFMAQTHSLIEALLAHELICEEGREGDGRIVYRVTDEGHATGMKSLIPRMSRAAAEALLEEVLVRVARINSDGEFLHYVTEARVFGSYLTESEDLGDLDLAIKLERRQVEGEWVTAARALADKSGRSLNFFQRLTFPETEVRRRIKSGLPRISLHETSELDENPQMVCKTVYAFTPPADREQAPEADGCRKPDRGIPLA
jgi:predicted nucleotidyltransferase